jgi:hypothetical protein
MEDGQYIFIRNIGCASWARVYFNIASLQGIAIEIHG